MVSAVDREAFRLITISEIGLLAACPVSGRSLTACRGTAGRPAGQAGHWQAGLPGLPGTGAGHVNGLLSTRQAKNRPARYRAGRPWIPFLFD